MSREALDLVEESGLTRAMTRVMLQTALDQAAVWLADGRPITVAVYLSASSLADVDLPEEIALMLADRGLAPSALQLEITEEFPMSDDARAAALVASTIALAHSLDLRMVAEGVETATALADLTRLGCDQAQGYFMSKPLPAADLDVWLGKAAAGRRRRVVPCGSFAPSLPHIGAGR